MYASVAYKLDLRGGVPNVYARPLPVPALGVYCGSGGACGSFGRVGLGALDVNWPDWSSMLAGVNLPRLLAGAGGAWLLYSLLGGRKGKTRGGGIRELQARQRDEKLRLAEQHGIELVRARSRAAA